MKIFITGVAGFLGSHLADRMIQLGHQVIGVDNLSGGYKDNVNKRVDFHVVDCNYLPEMQRLSRGCDVVFHAACTAYDGFSVVSPYIVTLNTFQNTMSVLSAAIKNKVKRFVYCSSMSRYGHQNQLPFKEDALCNPVVPYAIAKYSSELVIKKLCELNNVEYVILVPHNIIGPRQKYDDPYRNVAAIMINRMLKGQQPIIYGNGEQKRCFSFINDVIYCFEKALDSQEANKQIINVGPDEEFITINELAETLAEIIGFDLKPIYVKDRPLEIDLAYCSSDKARKILGYKTSTSLKEGLRSMVEHIKKQGPKDFSYNLEIEIQNGLTPKTWTEKLI